MCRFGRVVHQSAGKLHCSLECNWVCSLARRICQRCCKHLHAHLRRLLFNCTLRHSRASPSLVVQTRKHTRTYDQQAHSTLEWLSGCLGSQIKACQVLSCTPLTNVGGVLYHLLIHSEDIHQPSLWVWKLYYGALRLLEEEVGNEMQPHSKMKILAFSMPKILFSGP